MPVLIDDLPGLVNKLVARLGEEKVAIGLGASRDDLDALLRHRRSIPSAEWRVRGICEIYRFADLLLAHGVPPSVYDRYEPFSFDADPVGSDAAPTHLSLITRRTKLANFDIDFPFGVPACVLTPNYKWIKHFADRGFDILTYKTVRTRTKGGNEFPNWAFVELPQEGLQPGTAQELVGGLDLYPNDPNSFAMANSFGVPSQEPSVWQEDVRRTRDSIRRDGQVLIVSIMATPDDDWTLDDIKKDFVRAAAMARDAGAQIVEANYSCPNTANHKVEIFSDPRASSEVSRAVSKELKGSVPFFIKIGYLPPSRLRAVVETNKSYIDGIVAINTIPMPIVDQAGQQFFHDGDQGEKGWRKKAGVSGSAIRPFALETVRHLVKIRSEMRHDFSIIGVGGVMTPVDFEEMLSTGADAVASCTGAWFNTSLALETRIRGVAEEEPVGADAMRHVQDNDLSLMILSAACVGEGLEASRVRENLSSSDDQIALLNLLYAGLVVRDEDRFVPTEQGRELDKRIKRKISAVSS